MEKENIHKDHRKRVRENFLAHGFDDTTPFHKVLEMLLFYCVPRKDTNEIAHKIENKFKNLEELFEASPEEIKEIDGLNDNAVAFFKLLVYITGKYRSQRIAENITLNSVAKVGDFLQAKYLGETKETFAVTTLDNKGEFIAFDIINRGDVSSVAVSAREVMEIVFKRNATFVVISHNHPKGFATPSPDDIQLTERIAEALAHVNVKLIDHIILDSNDYISLIQTKEYNHIFNTKIY